MKIFDLPCFDTRKSFYGKAKVMESDNGEKVLISYNTEVAKITESGEVVRLWDGISQTTNRHFNSFLTFYDLPPVRFGSLEVCKV
jgi:hypothetical protein